MKLKKTFFIIAAISMASFLRLPRMASGGELGQTVVKEADFKLLPGTGKRIRVEDETYFIYEFNEKPKMGMVILKIQVYNKKKDKIIPFVITGRTDMPSMRGAHDSGEQEFKLSRRKDYLLPINIAMPGGWEIRLTFHKDDKTVFRGRLLFDV